MSHVFYAVYDESCRLMVEAIWDATLLLYYITTLLHVYNSLLYYFTALCLAGEDVREMPDQKLVLKEATFFYFSQSGAESEFQKRRLALTKVSITTLLLYYSNATLLLDDLTALLLYYYHGSYYLCLLR